MKIPSDNRWTQTNEGDVLGVLNRTRNITLDTPGKARLSQKSIAIMTPDLPTASDLEYGLAIVYYNSLYHIVHTAGVWTFDLEGASIGNTGSDPTPSIYGDGIIFNSLLLVTTTDNLSSYNGSAWTNSLESNTASFYHPMEIFDSLTTYKLAIGNVNTVKLLDTSYNNATDVLTLPTQYIVTTLAYNNGYLYVGTRNRNGGDAKIFIWNGEGNNADYEVPVSGNWVYSVKPYGKSVCAVTSAGELIRVEGATAVHMAGFPVYYKSDVTWQGTLESDVPRVFNRGMVTDGSLIYINVNALVDTGLSSDYMNGFESGVWVFDPDNGLYHKASTCFNDVYKIDASLSVSNSIITTSATHSLKDGDSVIFSSTSGLSGVDTLTLYYVSVQSATTIKLATSRKALDAEEFVTITGTAGSSDKLVYTPNTEYFQYARVSSGAITKPTAHDGYFKNWATPIIWTGSAQDSDIAARSYAVNILADSYNIGTIETQRIYSQNIEQAWKTLYSFIDGLRLDNEQIIVKYRNEEALGYPTEAILGTWASTNTINITRSDCPYIAVGNEVMIVDGYGRGYSAHVTAISMSTTVLSLTLDESVGTADGAVRFVATNYKKIGTYGKTRESSSYILGGIDTHSPWVMLKVELRGYGIAVNNFDLSNEIKKAGR